MLQDDELGEVESGCAGGQVRRRVLTDFTKKRYDFSSWVDIEEHWSDMREVCNMQHATMDVFLGEAEPGWFPAGLLRIHRRRGAEDSQHRPQQDLHHVTK